MKERLGRAVRREPLRLRYHVAWEVDWLWLCVWSETQKDVVTRYGAHRGHSGFQTHIGLRARGGTGAGRRRREAPRTSGDTASTSMGRRGASSSRAPGSAAMGATLGNSGTRESERAGNTRDTGERKQGNKGRAHT